VRDEVTTQAQEQTQDIKIFPSFLRLLQRLRLILQVKTKQRKHNKNGLPVGIDIM